MSCGFRIKTYSRIVNGQFDFIRSTCEGYFEFAYTAIFDRIVNGFLQDSEQTE